MRPKIVSLTIALGAREYGNDLMKQVAQEAFDVNPDLNIVTVNEHGGWNLSFIRSGEVVDSANDRAIYEGVAKEFRQSMGISEWESLPMIRRS